VVQIPTASKQASSSASVIKCMHGVEPLAIKKNVIKDLLSFKLSHKLMLHLNKWPAICLWTFFRPLKLIFVKVPALLVRIKWINAGSSSDS